MIRFFKMKIKIYFGVRRIMKQKLFQRTIEL